MFLPGDLRIFTANKRPAPDLSVAGLFMFGTYYSICSGRKLHKQSLLGKAASD
jgi:hypothetical protein